jgi:uncharacterized protein (TIGR02284 family)
MKDRDISDKDRHDSLQHLIAVCEDGVRAFEHAVVEVENRKLKGLFRELAISRKFAAVELRKLLRSLGGKTSESGTLTGSALRLYTQIKTAVADNDSVAILEELERSERRALEAFEDAAEREESGDFHDAIRALATEINHTLESLTALRKDLARPSDGTESEG